MRKLKACDLLFQSHLLRRFNAVVKHAMAGRTQNPKHMTLVMLQVSPFTVLPVLWLVGNLYHARFAAALARSWKIVVSLRESLNQRIVTVSFYTLFVVREHCHLVALKKRFHVAPSRRLSALSGAKLLVWSSLLCPKESGLTNAARNRHAKPVTGGRLRLPGSAGRRPAFNAAVVTDSIPRRELLVAMAARSSVLVSVNSCC